MALMKIDSGRVSAVGLLTSSLDLFNISYEVYYVADQNGFMVVFPNLKDRKGDVVLHDFSYGHEGNLFEGYGEMSTVDGDVCVFESLGEIVELAKQKGFYF
jgi:hypothetical protein